MSALKKIYPFLAALVMAALLVSHYTKRVDISSFKSKVENSQIADIQKDESNICCAIEDGSNFLILSNSYKQEDLLIEPSQLKEEVKTCAVTSFSCHQVPVRVRPYRPSCDCGELKVVGSLLYWQTDMGGMECEFATFNIVESVSGDVTTNIALVEDGDPEFLWDFGYRVGIDYRFPCSRWEARILYTHFDGGAVRRKDSTSNSGKWHLHYNIIEGAIARPICINSCFSLIPLGGIRYANIRQSIQADIFTRQVSGTSSSLYATDISNRQRYHGIGPEWGLIGQYDIGRGLNLFGGIEGAILYGRADMHHFRQDTFPGFVEINNSHNVSDISQLCFDACFGVNYTCCCCCRPLNFALAIEQHRIFNHNFMTCCSGNLVLNGLSLSASFNF